MADIVLNGKTYHNVEEVMLPDGNGVYVAFSSGGGGSTGGIIGGGVETIIPEYTIIQGEYVNVSSQWTQNSSNYSRTSEIQLKKGDILRFTTLVRTACALAESLGANYYRGLIIEPDYVSTAKDYEYTAEKDMLVVICQREQTLANVSIERVTASQITGATAANNYRPFDAKTLNGNLSIKAFKEYRFSDGTQPLYKNVLWHDGSGGFYISDDVHSDKHALFAWDYGLSDGKSPDMYAAHITDDGSVLFIFGTQHLSNSASATPSDNHRMNPIIYAPDKNGVYKAAVIDFGDNLKPTNWLQNVGVLTSARHDCIIFCEYTRANEETARVWRVTTPYTDVNNWSVIMEQTVAHPYGEGGFKHFHTVQEDPYHDVIYVTSGDDASSSGCWASTDGGVTFTQVGSYDNAKWRMLNMVFLDDFVYWASDDWTPRHKVWKASRDDNGIISYDSITEVASFPDTSGSRYVATYASVYLSCYDAILFLDRCDNDDGIVYLPVCVYDLETGELSEVGRIYPADDATYPFIGFRNTAVMLFPRDNKIAVGYDLYYANYNKLLGNEGTHTFATQVNNLIMTVIKSGEAYKLTYDTVK